MTASVSHQRRFASSISLLHRLCSVVQHSIASSRDFWVSLPHGPVRQHDLSIEQRLSDHMENYLRRTLHGIWCVRLRDLRRPLESLSKRCLRLVRQMKSPGCTAFVFPSTCTEVKTILAGQNTDRWRPFTKHFATLRSKKESALRILMTTPAGFIGYVGQNSRRIAVYPNGLVFLGH